MNIKTIGHDLEHNIWLVASLFFDNSEDVDIVSSVTFSNNMFHSRAAISYNGTSYNGEHSFPCNVNSDVHAQKRIMSAVCGMAIYRAASLFCSGNLPWGVMTGIRPAKPLREMLATGATESDVHSYFSNLYGITDKKLNLAMTVAKNEMSLLSVNKPTDIGLYIGIPFCPTRCLYCSFISSDLRYTKKYVPEYCKLLVDEMRHSAMLLTASGMRIQTIYMGGGTPTSLSAQDLDFLLSNLHECFDLSSLHEFCVEAGRPDTITADKLAVLKKHFVNRLSINPQTMNQETLTLIGRNHSPTEINNAFSLAREMGFDNINADIIAGLPGEDVNMFGNTLESVLALSPENITVHTMSIKRGSRLNQIKQDFSLSEHNAVQQMLDITHESMPKNGYTPYYMYRQKHMIGNLENVSYSKPGFMSIYNVNIMEEVQSILALGCGGSSKAVNNTLNRIERVYNFKSPIEYINRFSEILDKKTEFFNLLSWKEC